MQPVPYIFFTDTCREAITFWAGIFGTEPQITSAGEAMPGADPELVMHAALPVGEGFIYASDDLSGDAAPKMAGVSIHVEFPTIAEARRVFEALSDGGEIRMPLETTFWAPAFGTCSDRFGVRWMVSAKAA